MKFLVFIKGDGRGHITQALALQQMLVAQGHKIEEFIVGCPPDTKLPAFLYQKATAPIERVYSPNLVPDAKNQGIDLPRTVFHGLRSMPELRHSFSVIGEKIRRYRPDVLISLYEPTLALYSMFYKHKIPMVHIAHQYLMLHERFMFPPGRGLERQAVLNYTKFTRFRTNKMLALSFYEVPDDTQQHIYTIPPLLRSELFEQKVSEEDHFLVYLLNHGLGDDVKRFNEKRPDIRIHAFWNNKEVEETVNFSDTLTFHQLNDKLFLQTMATSRGVACTAGFETVSEAFYLRKPALLMPSANQYEQYANAFDAEQVGAGKMATSLDLQQLLDFIPKYQPQHETYRRWMEQSPKRLLAHLENP